MKKHWIDYMRVFAMLGVICVHVSTELFNQFGKISGVDWWTANVINGTFKGAVCLFPMIAGCLLLGKKYDLKEFYVKRAVRLVIPFMFWTIFYVIFRVYKGDDLLWLLKQDFFMHASVSIHLWFFSMYICLMLFVPFINYFIIGNKPSRDELLLLIMIITGFFCLSETANIISNIKDYDMDWFQVFPWFLGYLLGGYFIDVYADELKFSNATVFAIFIVLSALGIMLNYFACHSLGIVDDSLFFGRTGILVFFRCLCLFYLFRNNSKRLAHSLFIAPIAEASFGIYLIHPFIADVIKRNLGLHVGYASGYGIIYMFTLIVLVFSVSFLSIHFIRKLSFSKYIM